LPSSTSIRRLPIRHCKTTTKELIHRRTEIAHEFAGTPDSDFIGSGADLFSGLRHFPVDTEEQKLEEDKQINRRKRWILHLVPSEMWRMPVFTGVLMEEACRCYVYAGGYATVAMCQAVTESLLRRIAGGSEVKYYKLLNKLHQARVLSGKQASDLRWLSSLRNPFLHTGCQRKYAKAMLRSLMPKISRGTISQKVLLESDAKRALKLTSAFLHHFCQTENHGSSAITRWMNDVERYRRVFAHP